MQHDRAHRRIACDLLGGVDQTFEHRSIECVVFIRAHHGHRCHAIGGYLHPNPVFAHASQSTATPRHLVFTDSQKVVPHARAGCTYLQRGRPGRCTRREGHTMTTHNFKAKGLVAALGVAAAAAVTPAVLFAGAGTAQADDCYGELSYSYYCSPASSASDPSALYPAPEA